MSENIIFGVGIGIVICVILNIIIDEFWNSRNRRFNMEIESRTLDAKSDAYGIVESIISVYFPYRFINNLEQDDRDFVLQKAIEHIDRIKVYLEGKEIK